MKHADLSRAPSSRLRAVGGRQAEGARLGGVAEFVERAVVVSLDAVQAAVELQGRDRHRPIALAGGSSWAIAMSSGAERECLIMRSMPVIRDNSRALEQTSTRVNERLLRSQGRRA